MPDYARSASNGRSLALRLAFALGKLQACLLRADLGLALFLLPLADARTVLVVVCFGVLEELALLFRFGAGFDLVALAAFAGARFLVCEVFAFGAFRLVPSTFRPTFVRSQHRARHSADQGADDRCADRSSYHSTSNRTA